MTTMNRIEAELKAHAAMKVIDGWLQEAREQYIAPEKGGSGGSVREALVQALANEIRLWAVPQELAGWYCEPVIEVTDAWAREDGAGLKVPMEPQPVTLDASVPDAEAAAVQASLQRKREGLWRVYPLAAAPAELRTIPTYSVIQVPPLPDNPRPLPPPWVQPDVRARER